MARNLILEMRRSTDDETTWTQVSPGGDPFVVREEEPPIFIRVSGPAGPQVQESHFQVLRGVKLMEPQGRIFRWQPFEHRGRLCYGLLPLVVKHPSSEGTLTYMLEIVPGQLSDQLWDRLFSEVCAVADGLLTRWGDDEGPRYRSGPPGALLYSPATALAEMGRGWSAFERSLRRIARRPRTDFHPPRPGQVRAEDGDGHSVPTADIYENRLVRQTIQRLAANLRLIRHRARTSYDVAERRARVAASVGASKGALAVFEEEATSRRAIVEEAEQRLRVVSSLSQQLPTTSTFRLATPHVSARVRKHPDYYQVVQWWRKFGHERVSRIGGGFTSANEARLASQIYEFWCLLALVFALRQTGWQPLFPPNWMVRTDLFELELRRNEPIPFQRGEDRLCLWYEPVATAVQNEQGERRKFNTGKQWDKFWSESPAVAQGLYSRTGYLTPDYWIELFTPSGAIAAVADARFSPGVDPTSGIPTEDVYKDKAEAINKYVGCLTSVRDGRILRPFDQGLVIFAGTWEAANLIAQESTSQHARFLPLLPMLDSEVTLGTVCRPE